MLLGLLLASPLAALAQDPLAEPQELLDAGQAAAALELLNSILQRHPTDARALLMRSTAEFMIGSLEAGERDLHSALELDPGLRQGWLNLAGVEVAASRYDKAYTALLRARELDPLAPDNDLNLGAVLLLQGKLTSATEHFESYLQGQQDSSDAFYLVASNYALVGYSALAIENLRRAIELDERTRVRARTDSNFRDLAGNREFQRLLAEDAYRPPPGAYQTSRAFPTPYDASDGKLLGAVLDALQYSGFPFDPRIEVTADWALIWGEMRIKVSHGPEGMGAVEVSAPAGSFTPSQWQERIESLFAQILLRLQMRTPRTASKPAQPPGH